MTDHEQDEYDREYYYGGTDEYVSDCNKLPFTGPFFPVTSSPSVWAQPRWRNVGRNLPTASS